MHPRVVAIVQARMGSTRLPGKVLTPLAGRPMIDWVVSRLARSTTITEVMVATSTLAQDDVLADHCVSQGVRVVRGDPVDLLDRYVLAARESDADVIVRITSDCPLIDPALTDQVVRALLATPEADFASNNLAPRTYPRGLDASAMTRRALLDVDEQDRDPGTREHVTPLLETSARYRRVGVTNEEDCSDVRWTVDTPEDLAALDALCAHFGGRDDFTWTEALDAWRVHPDWQALNAGVEQKPVVAQLERPGEQ